MGDPRNEYLKDVNFNTIEISEYPQIAFLCGGEPGTLTDSDDSGAIKQLLPFLRSRPKQYFPSIRSFISQLLTIRNSNLRCQNAEDIKDWNSYSAYEDLIEFEKDIAHICKAIVLFVESPGSIAELGSFTIIPEITKKLIIFVHSEFSDATSFISLGPIKRIQNEFNDKIHFIPWEMEKRSINGESVSVVLENSMKHWGPYACDAIKDFVDTKIKIDHSSEENSRTKETLFIHDIAILFKAITTDEIYDYFKFIKHQVDKKTIERSIFCLEKLDLIRPVNRGHKTYYVPDDPVSNGYLNLHSGKDSARLAMQLSAYYEHPSQLARREAISYMMGGRK